jgi:hypothetical protein
MLADVVDAPPEPPVLTDVVDVPPDPPPLADVVDAPVLVVVLYPISK